MGTPATWRSGSRHSSRYASQAMTLEPGDLIATGTPAGVGPLTAGDIVEVEIPGVGVLRDPWQRRP